VDGEGQLLDYRKTIIHTLKRAQDAISDGKPPAVVARATARRLQTLEPPPEESLELVLASVLDASPELYKQAIAEFGGPGVPEVVEVLQSLLQDEYLQRDVYEQYGYLIFGPEGIAVQEHLAEHMEEEMQHILTLQRYITGFGDTPTFDRLPIPVVPPTLRDIMELDQALERQAVARYSAVISLLEAAGAQFIPLRVDLENIVSQEQEHLFDLDRWLKNNGWKL